MRSPCNGNTQNDGSFTYAYDEENRLTTVTRNSDSAVVGQYQYDALSRRVQKIANAAGVATTTLYFNDDARIVEEQNAAGTTQATYVYGNYIDEVLTMDRAGQTSYYHQNALWSVEAITDSTATPVERYYAYDAYGSVTISNGSGAPLPPNAWGTQVDVPDSHAVCGGKLKPISYRWVRARRPGANKREPQPVAWIQARFPAAAAPIAGQHQNRLLFLFRSQPLRKDVAAAGEMNAVTRMAIAVIGRALRRSVPGVARPKRFRCLRKDEPCISKQRYREIEHPGGIIACYRALHGQRCRTVPGQVRRQRDSN